MKLKNLYLLLALGLMLNSAQLWGENSELGLSEKRLPQNAKNDAAFIPRPWQLREKIQGDLNGDGREDVVLVLNHPQAQDNVTNTVGPTDPVLVILFRQSDQSLSLSLVQQGAIFCQSCGGVFGDPYNGIEIKNRSLVINHYGGSNWRWSYTDRFRWQNNDWVMIGHTVDRYISSEGPDFDHEEDHNLSTGNFSIRKNTPKKNLHEEKIFSKKTIRLQDYNLNDSYQKAFGKEVKAMEKLVPPLDWADFK